MLVDLRSDTVTKPSAAMLEAMLSAPIGDDVFEEDPTVVQLENKLANIFGKPAGLFFPSGTMANQVAIKVLTTPGKEIICDQNSHIYLYEGGGLAFNSGLSVWLVQGDRGRITAHQVEESIRPNNIYSPRTALVSLENTHNRGGGSIYSMQDVIAIKTVCDKHNIPMHLDGARIFNALAEADYNAVDIGKQFDTISVCLSKGLGAPVGSVLVASAEIIQEARRVRKVMGGGMRQVGLLAAAGIYALDNNVTGLKNDHKRAVELGRALVATGFIEDPLAVETNIIVAKLHTNFPVSSFIKKLDEQQIKIAQFGTQTLRMVTHLDFNDDMLEYVCQTLSKIKPD